MRDERVVDLQRPRRKIVCKLWENEGIKEDETRCFCVTHDCVSSRRWIIHGIEVVLLDGKSNEPSEIAMVSKNRRDAYLHEELGVDKLVFRGHVLEASAASAASESGYAHQRMPHMTAHAP